MIGLDNMSITGGQLVSYGIGAALAKVDHGWRAMVALGAVPAIVLCCLLPFCPESPRQLIYHDKPEEAAKVIQRIFPLGTPEQVQQKVNHISLHVQTAKALRNGKGTFWLLKQLYVVPSNLRALIAACGLMAISQLGGFNSLMYYSSTLFSLVGFSNPVAVGTTIAATNFIFTWVNLMLVDRIGRRRVLLCTMWAMVRTIWHQRITKLLTTTRPSSFASQLLPFTGSPLTMTSLLRPARLAGQHMWCLLA
jgi:SP family myo-inositol transporter-like MFS transporter 13